MAPILDVNLSSSGHESNQAGTLYVSVISMFSPPPFFFCCLLYLKDEFFLHMIITFMTKYVHLQLAVYGWGPTLASLVGYAQHSWMSFALSLEHVSLSSLD